MASMLACKSVGLTDEEIMRHLISFRGLEHRIEFVGKFRDILFYNDSISTIPEATIAAVKTLKKVDTLILGGFDRGIEYTLLFEFFKENPIANVVFIGPAGKRIFQEWQQSGIPMPANFLCEDELDTIVEFAYQNTAKNKICLLSPAAASYDRYKNFEERGQNFKEAVKQLSDTGC